MMLKNIIWAKMVIVFLAISFASYGVYKKTDSVILSCLTPFLLLFVWMVVEFVFARLASDDYLEYIKSYGELIDKSDHDCIQDYMFFRDEANPISVSVLGEGVYLSRSLICTALIPWSSVVTLSFFTHKDIFLARLHVKNESSSDRSLCIPWKKGFDELIPDSVTVINN